MAYFFFPSLVLLLITHKIIFFYVALACLGFIVIASVLEHSFKLFGEIGENETVRTVLFWIALGCGAVIIYFMMH